MVKSERNSDIECAYKKIKNEFIFEKNYTRKQIIDIVNTVYKNETSILPSDYCYNRINVDLVDDFEKRLHLFEYVKKNTYKYLGENFKYTGNIEHLDKCVGRWENGKILHLDKDKILYNNLSLQYN